MSKSKLKTVHHRVVKAIIPVYLGWDVDDFESKTSDFVLSYGKGLSSSSCQNMSGVLSSYFRYQRELVDLLRSELDEHRPVLNPTWRFGDPPLIDPFEAALLGAPELAKLHPAARTKVLAEYGYVYEQTVRARPFSARGHAAMGQIAHPSKFASPGIRERKHAFELLTAA